MSPNMPPTPMKRGRSLGQPEGQEALDMWCPRARDVCGRGNPVWMHVLKLGKVVDEIAEHFVEKRVRRGRTVRQALHVMKDSVA